MTAARLPRADHVPRLGALAAIVALIAALLVAVTPAPAHADDITCPENPPRGSGHVIAGKWLYVIHLKYAEPAFFKGSGTVIENETDANAGRTATVAVSQTHTIQEVTSAGATRTIIKDVLNTTGSFSRTITDSVTVSRTVADTFTVAPRTAIQADYGIYGYNTTFDLDVWELGGGRCWYYPERSPRGVSRSVPADPGWRLQTYPRINVNGVVNAADYSSTLRPGGVAAIFGSNFSPPDRVIVRQGGAQWTVQYGSPWWYDASQQINATLPADLRPGAATVSVLGSNGLEALNPRTVFIS